MLTLLLNVFCSVKLKGRRSSISLTGRKVWRHLRGRTAPAGGRKSRPETTDRRSQSGQGNAAGRHPKKILRPPQKPEAVEYLLAAYRIGVRRGCWLMMQSRTVYNYCCCRDDRALTQRIRETHEYNQYRPHSSLNN